MGKIKIHELAKKLNIDNKELLKKAKELNIEAKSHLSAIDTNDAERLEQLCQKNIKNNKGVINTEKEEKTKKPVIIRREVIINDEETAKKQEEEKKKMQERTRQQVGFVDVQRKKDFNIVYRDKKQQPLTVNELFGIKKPSKEEKKEVSNTQEITEEMEKIEPKEQEKITNNVETKQRPNNITNQNNNNQKHESYNNQNNNSANNYQNNRNNNEHNNKQWNNRNTQSNFNNRNGQNNFNNNRNGQNSFNNRAGQNNFNANRQQGSYNRFGQQNGFNRNNNQNSYGKRPLDDRGIDKNIKNIMSVDIVEKENVREYANKAIDKQKIREREDTRVRKQTGKTRRDGESDINEDKLKDLKQESKLSHMFKEGTILDYYDLSTTRGRKNRKKVQKLEENHIKQKIFKLTDITIPETISVKDIAIELKKTSGEVIKKLLDYGIMATINNELDFDTAFLLAGDFGVLAHKKEIVKEEDILFDDSEDKVAELVDRPPVVVVMGHVDHGKTSLLDAVRLTNVIEGEAGGITQHIGAHKVEVNGREITFLDTPGHEAFTAMRARGAQVTDIAILVVAANDGVMPQTVEAINHAKAANIPIIVAINKIDLEGANPEKIKQDLAQYGLVSEEWGGETIFVPISAKKKTNIDTLLEMVLLVADLKGLKANPYKQAKGTIVEARLDKNKGPIATMLVQRGTLDVGDTIVVGSVIGRIRVMKNDKGQNVKSAGPSTPVEITGLTEVPEAGETFYEVKDEKTAKHLIERRKRQARDKLMSTNSKVTLDDLFSQIEKGSLKQLNIIVKADVQGSVEAVKQSLEKLSDEKVKVSVIHANVGGVTETDVTLAKVSNAIIIAFNTRPEPMAKQTAEKEGIEIKMYSVIYNAIEDVQAAMKGMLDPEFKEVIIGTAEVRQTFKVSNVGTIAGCYILTGKITRNSIIRVIRENIVIHEGEITSLKRFKDDVKEISKEYECGLQLKDFNDIKEGDILEAHILEEVK